MKPDTIIWDFDGTLLPSDPYDSEQTLLRYKLTAVEEKISIFKKFETVIEGGTKFNNSLSSNNMSKEECLKILMESKLKAFSIR